LSDLSDAIYLQTAAGALQLRPGRSVVARVVRVDGDRVRLAIAGGEIDVRASARLAPGAVVRLTAEALGDGRIALRIAGDGARPAAGDGWSA